MGRETVDDMYLRAYWIIQAEYADLPSALRQQTAPSAVRLKANEHDRVSFVRQPLNQMVKNASACGHAIGRNDDRRKMMIVDRLRFLHRSGKMYTLCV